MKAACWLHVPHDAASIERTVTSGLRWEIWAYVASACGAGISHLYAHNSLLFPTHNSSSGKCADAPDGVTIVRHMNAFPKQCKGTCSFSASVLGERPASTLRPRNNRCGTPVAVARPRTAPLPNSPPARCRTSLWQTRTLAAWHIFF